MIERKSNLWLSHSILPKHHSQMLIGLLEISFFSFSFFFFFNKLHNYFSADELTPWVPVIAARSGMNTKSLSFMKKRFLSF